MRLRFFVVYVNTCFASSSSILFVEENFGKTPDDDNTWRKPPKANMRRVQRNGSKYKSESYTFLFYKKKTFQIISFSIHIYFFLFENTINTLVMLSWAWFFWSDWFCNSGFWIGASEISFGMKWFVTLYMSHVTFSQNIMVICLLDSKLSEELTFSRKNELLGPTLKKKLLCLILFVGGLY